MAFYFESGMAPQMLIPQVLADSYLSIATGAQIKVILCLIRFSGMPLTEESIAKHCHLEESEVKSAIDFWLEQKMLSRCGSTLCLQTPQTVQDIKLPIYSSDEILEMSEADKTFKQILEETQSILGKILNHNDASILYGIYDHLGFSGDLIMQLLGFCTGNGKTGFRYIERVALDWHDRGIDSFEKADAYIHHLEQIAQDEHRVAVIFGIDNRALSKKERQFIATWREEMQFHLDMIEAAYNICVDSKGKLSFPYINGILSDWHAKKIKTPDQITEKQPQKNTKKKQLSDFERAALAKSEEEIL